MLALLSRATRTAASRTHGLRALVEALPLTRSMSTVVVSSAPESGSSDEKKSSPYMNRIVVDGKHEFIADEPESVGGGGMGPGPYDLLLSALGACTSMTIKMYATRKGLSLQDVEVALSHSKIYAADCKACTEEKKASADPKKKIDVIQRTITLRGTLTQQQRQRLLEIADMCPVHRTLGGSPAIITSLAPE